MGKNRSCCFLVLKWAIMVYLILLLLAELTALILFSTNFEQVVQEMEKNERSLGQLNGEEKDTFKVLMIVALTFTLLLTLIQLIGVYRESVCIVTIMVIAMVIVIIINAVNTVRTKASNSYAISSLTGSSFWAAICLIYACAIHMADKQDAVVPYRATEESA